MPPSESGSEWSLIRDSHGHNCRPLPVTSACKLVLSASADWHTTLNRCWYCAADPPNHPGRRCPWRLVDGRPRLPPITLPSVVSKTKHYAFAEDLARLKCASVGCRIHWRDAENWSVRRRLYMLTRLYRVTYGNRCVVGHPPKDGAPPSRPAANADLECGSLECPDVP